MSALELLGRMNAKAGDYLGLPAGFATLTPIDISHALSFVEGNGPRLLGRVMFAQQGEFLKALEYELTQDLKAHAKRGKWRNIGPIPKLSTVAVRLYAFPQRCKKCEGVGERMWGARRIVCQRCHGSTWEPITNADIARTIGVSDAAMSESWERRLGVALDTLGQWHRRCSDGLHDGLRR